MCRPRGNWRGLPNTNGWTVRLMDQWTEKPIIATEKKTLPKRLFKTKTGAVPTYMLWKVKMKEIDSPIIYPLNSPFCIHPPSQQPFLFSFTLFTALSVFIHHLNIPFCTYSPSREPFLTHSPPQKPFLFSFTISTALSVLIHHLNSPFCTTWIKKKDAPVC